MIVARGEVGAERSFDSRERRHRLQQALPCKEGEVRRQDRGNGEDAGRIGVYRVCDVSK